MKRPSPRQIVIATALAIAAGVLAGFWDEIASTWRGLLVGLIVLGTVLALVSRRPRITEPRPDPGVELLEQVVADESRRPWNPTTLPWLPGADVKQVLLVPAADYHLAEMVPLAKELERRGIQAKMAIGTSPWTRTQQGIHWYGDLEMFALPTPEEVIRDVSLVVTTKDTGSMTDWVSDVREAGVPVVGKVEGAQDFWDSDTPEARRPYRNLDLVLCQGQFDADALSDQKTAIVGSTRLERLWWAPPASPRRPLALINLNFVYGVRTSDRDLWLTTAIAGCEEAGVPYVVSIHPAERARLKDARSTRVSASRLLPFATVLISRFSTMPFEAMARGVPFVYHNPHGETVKTFAESYHAFETSTDAASLGRVLSDLAPPGAETRAKTSTFFRHLISVVDDHRSEERAGNEVARVAADALAGPPR